MLRIGVVNLIKDYHFFSKEFWLSYKTLEKVMSEIDFAEIKMKLLKSKKIILEQIKGLDIEKFKIERALLEKEWSDKNEEAKLVGITTHEQIHNLFCTNIHSVKVDFGIDTDMYQLQLTESFLKTDKGIFNEFKIEIPIDESMMLVGIVDCIVKDGNHVCLYDWKTDEKILFRSMYEVGKKKSKRMKFPLVNLEDAPGVHYLLLLSIYAWMLQQLDPNLIIDNLVIVLVSNMRKKKSFPVEYLKDDVQKLIKWHVKSVHLKEEMDKCNPLNFEL